MFTSVVIAPVRQLRRAPGLFALVILTLSLGIGATTAIFGIVDTLFLRPLPYPHGDRLADVWTTNTKTGRATVNLSGETIGALREEQPWLTAVEMYQMDAGVLSGAGDPTIGSAPRVSPGLLRLLGVAPRLGRLFADDETTAAAGTPHVALISESLWRSRFGGVATVLGRRIAIDDESYTIVGVLPETFRFPESCDVWRPIEAIGGRFTSRYHAIVSLRPGLTREALNAHLRNLAPQMQQAGTLPRDQAFVLDDLLQQRLPRRLSAAFYVMLAAVSLMLLVAIVNVANLLLVRASARTSEFALLGALGATRADLLRQMAAEGLFLALLSLAGSLFVANGWLAILTPLIPREMTYPTILHPTPWDWRVLAFSTIVSTITCVTVSALPALRVSRLDLIATLQNRSAATTVGTTDERWQSMLIVAQLAIVLVLLAGAGLLLRSFVQLVSVDLGIDRRNLLVFDIPIPPVRYTAPGAALTLMQRLHDAIEHSPDVERATFSEFAPPLPGRASMGTPEADGQPPPGAVLQLLRRQVAPDYFATLGVPIREGRTFRPDDPDTVAIVGSALARRLWNGASPIGRRLRLDSSEPWLTVIGVAGDVALMAPDAPDAEPLDTYIPHQRRAPARLFSLIVRTRGHDAAVLQLVKDRLRALDDRLPIYEIRTMDQRYGEWVAKPRLFVGLAGAFATLAVLLAAVGVYGTAAYWVARRRREIGIRIALGARPTRVVAMILGRSVRLAIAGGAIGLASAFAARRLLDSLRFVTSTRDPVTLIGVTALLLALVLLACYLPARRASRLDPSIVLRGE
jgi:putative ABC transport system permease protein